MRKAFTFAPIQGKTYNMIWLKHLMCCLFMAVSSGYAQNSFLGLNGGFEGTAAIVNGSTNASPVATNWTKSTATATIANETTTVRSGANAMKITSTSGTLCRVFSPLVGISTSNNFWQVQYYRRVANTTNTVQNQVGNYRNTTEQTNGTYTSPASANVWEKQTYTPSLNASATSAAADFLVQLKAGGSGGDVYIDDVVLYESASVDVTAPNSPTSPAATPTSNSVTLNWTASSGGTDGGAYMVVRYTVSPNADNDPNANGIYAAGNTYTNGTGGLTGTVLYVGTNTTFTNIGLSSGFFYVYKIYAFDKAYNYSAEAAIGVTTLTPTITGVSPTSACQGQSVVITGTNFTGATSVTFGGIAATGFTVNNPTQITATVSTGASGLVAVTVPGGGTAQVNVFTFNTASSPPTSITGTSTICAGASTTLTVGGGALGTGAIVQWFAAGCNSTVIGTGPSITVSPSSTTTYAARYSGTCNTTGCILQTVTVNPLPATPTISANGPTNLCTGGSVVLTSSAGNSYLWSNGATTQSITVSASGNFTVKVFSASGCESAVSAAAQVVVNANPTAALTNTGGSCVGSAALSVANTGISSTIDWYNGATLVQTNSGSFSAAGTVVAGGNGAGSAANQLNEPFHIAVDAAGNVYVSDQNNHRVQKWAPGATSGVAVAGGNGSGTATNQLSSPTGVFVDAAGNVYVSDRSNSRVMRWAPSATSGVLVAGGNGSGSALNQLNSNNGIYVDGLANVYISDLSNHRVMKWVPGATAGVVVAGGNGGGNAANQLNSPTGVFVDQAGNVFVSDQNNGRVMKWAPGATSGTVVASGGGLSFNQGIYVDALGVMYIANLGSVLKWVQGAPSGTTVATGSNILGVSMDSSGNLYTAAQNDHNVKKWAFNTPANTYTPVAAGSFTAVVTNPAGCSTTSNAITIFALPSQPTISTGGPTTFCIGNSVVLTSSAASSYLWSNGATTQSITVSTSGNYTVQVTNANGCQSVASAVTTVIVNPLPATPTISANAATSFCEGGNVVLTSSAGSSYLWSNGATTPSITVSASGDYSVQVTNANGCQSAASAATSVTVYPLPSNTIYTDGPTTICQGEDVVLMVAEAAAYLWSNGATTQWITVSEAGNYTVTITSADGCSSVGSQSVSVLPLPTVGFTASATHICFGENITLTGTGNAVSYSWSGGVSNGVAFSPKQSGFYTVTGTGANGCVATATVGITVEKSMTQVLSKTFTTNGSTSVNGNCYTVTTQPNQRGSAWYPETIDLNKDFDIRFTKRQCGAADGMVFVLHRSIANVNALGGLGSDMGYYSYGGGGNQFAQSLAVELDLYNSGLANYNDNGTSHIAIVKNGVSQPLVSPSYVSLATCTNDTFRVKWNHTTKQFSVYLGNNLITTYTDDLVNTIFGGNSQVYMGFTGATGDSWSEQSFCYNPQDNTLKIDPTYACGSATLGSNASQGLNYLWSNGATTPTITITQSGTYSLTVSNAFGCSESASMAIIVDAPLASTLSTNGSCVGATLSLSGTGATDTINWFKDGTETANSFPTYYQNTSTAPIVFGTSVSPRVICKDGTGNIYVWDANNASRVLKYAPGSNTGVTVAGGNGFGSGLNQLTNVSAMCVDASGNLYIADLTYHRVMKWVPGATAGIVVAGNNSQGNASNQLNYPTDIAVDAAGAVYVQDNNNYRIQKWLPGATSGTTVAAGSQGSGLNQVNNMAGIALDGSGNIYVVDLGNNRILKWKPGITNATVVVNGSGGQLSSPYGLAVSASGYIFIGDRNSYRIQRYAPSGTSWLTVAGGQGYGSAPNQIGTLFDFFVDGAENIYVCDYLGTLIKKWTAIQPAQFTTFSAGTYNAVVSSAVGCVVTTNSVTINPVPTATITASGPLAFCTGNTVSLSAATASSYLWSTGETTKDITVSVSGNYTVQVTNEFGCQATSAATAVVVNPLPSGSLSTVGGNTCELATINLSGTTAGDSMAWYRNGIQLTSVNAYPSNGTALLSGSGSGLNQMNNPTAVFKDNAGNIYVSDIGNDRVLKYAPGSTIGTIVAGNGNGGGNADQLNDPFAIFVDAAGNVYVSDYTNHRVMKWSPGATAGVVVAGGNGSGTAANQLSYPRGITVDASGNLYIADFNNHRIQKWAPGATSGITIAGGNGQGNTAVHLYYPQNLCLDGSGNLYVADTYNHRIQRFPVGSTTGVTVAGGNGLGGAGNQFAYPSAVSVSASGFMFVSDTNNHRIQKWTIGATSGTTVAGGNGGGTAANQVPTPFNVFVDANENIFIPDYNNNRLLRWQVTPVTSISNVIPGIYYATVTNATGCGKTTNSITINPRPIVTITPAGPISVCTGTNVTLTSSEGVSYLWSNGATKREITVSTAGNYTVEVTNEFGCKTVSAATTIIINPNPVPMLVNTGSGACLNLAELTLNTSALDEVTWYNGTTPITVSYAYASTAVTLAGPAGGSGLSQFNQPIGITRDAAGNIYIADTNNARVMRWAPGASSGTVVAGGNGTGSAANQLNFPWAVAVDVSRNVYVSDLNNNRVMKWAPGATTGVVVAGGSGGSSPLQLNVPRGITLDGSGNLYVADMNNNRIQKFIPGSLLGITVAGGNGQGSGLNQLSLPMDMDLDTAGNLYVADYANARIMKFTIGVQAGVVAAGGNGNSSGANQLSNPSSVRVNKAGDIFIADTGNSRIQRWVPGAISGTTVLGNGGGSASNQLNSPFDIFMDAAENILVADYNNYRIQEIRPTRKIIPPAGGTYKVTATNIYGCTSTSNNITIDPAPSAVISGGTTICGGTPVTLSVPAAASYLWSTGATTQSIVVTNPGTFGVTVTSAAGCQASSLITLTGTPMPVIEASNPQLCNGEMTTLSVQGNFGSALQFNGSNQYLLTPNLSSRMTASFTVELWIKPTAPGVILTELRQSGINTGNHSSQLEILSNGNVMARVWPLNTILLGNIAFGTWHHVAIRYNSATSRLDGLIDGVPSSAFSIGTRSGPGAQYWAFGAIESTNMGSGAWFNGQMDEVRIWNSALINAQVLQNYNATNVTVVPGLIAYYKLNGNLTDSSMYNATPWVSQDSYAESTAGPYTSILWSNGATTPTITIGTGGQYTVTVTKGECSLTSAPKVITSGNSNITPQGYVIACGPQVLTANEGSSYLWSNGATTRSITVTESGSYSVFVDGCPSIPTIVSMATVTIANGGLCSGSTTLTASGTAQSQQFNWTGPTGFTTTTEMVIPVGSLVDRLTITSPSNAYAYNYGMNFTVYIDLYNPVTSQWVNISTLTTSSGVSFNGMAINFPMIEQVSKMRYRLSAGFTAQFNTVIFNLLSVNQYMTYLWSTGATTQSINVSTPGTYTVSVNGCTPVVVNVINKAVGNPSVFGDNVWNVYAWNSGGQAQSSGSWNTNYSGYYVAAGVNFNTESSWNSIASPSSTPGYMGCPVNNDLHSWSAKRQGFPTGYYSINVDSFDDEAELYVNGVMVWERPCCGSQANVWQGFLGSSDKIEFRITEGSGLSMGSISFHEVTATTTANLTMYIQGYYIGAGMMNSVKYNQDYVSDTDQVEELTVSLHDAVTNALVEQTRALLHTDGSAQAGFTTATGTYYLAIKGRNSLETWSANPLTIDQGQIVYDFTSAASQAYGDNLVEVEPGVYAIYSGDLNADGYIEFTDYTIWESDANNFAEGNFDTDLNGDGFVEFTDYTIWESNANSFISTILPF
jgi:sugar lactone lactonase YvrE